MTVYDARLFPITLSFTQTFTKGNLKGLSTTETLPFRSIESAQVWLKGIEKNKYRLDYTVTNVLF